MPEYRVVWSIDLEADNPAGAALLALSIQRDPDSIATFFEVTDNREGDMVGVDFGRPETWGDLEHDDECITLCPVSHEEKCRIGHSCWCASEILANVGWSDDA